jgi:hypothetical protein
MSLPLASFLTVPRSPADSDMPSSRGSECAALLPRRQRPANNATPIAIVWSSLAHAKPRDDGSRRGGGPRTVAVTGEE